MASSTTRRRFLRRRQLGSPVAAAWLLLALLLLVALLLVRPMAAAAADMDDDDDGPMTTLPAYNEDVARYLAEMNAAAYACGSYEGCGKWTCTSCLQHPNTEVLRFASEETSTSGFVGYDPDAQRIVLAYAGTQPGDIQAWYVHGCVRVGGCGVGGGSVGDGEAKQALTRTHNTPRIDNRFNNVNGELIDYPRCAGCQV